MMITNVGGLSDTNLTKRGRLFGRMIKILAIITLISLKLLIKLIICSRNILLMGVVVIMRQLELALCQSIRLANR